MVLNWQEVSLIEIYEIHSGLSKPRSQFGFGYGFLAFKDVLDNYFVPDNLTALVNSTEQERETCSVRRGDVFLTRTSETMEDLGMSSVALKDYPSATFNGFTKRLRPKPNAAVVPEYAAYFFRSPRFRRDVTAMSSLSTRASLNNEMIARLKIILPPVEVQERIGNILKSLDDKIELNRRMNETLEAMARRLFKSWFVDFDPVHAKAALRRQHPKLSNADLSRRALPNLDPKIAERFPDSFQDSPLGRIPKGWVCKSLREVADIQSGGTPKKSCAMYWDGSLPWISPKVMNEIHVHDSDDRVTPQAVGNGTRLVPAGSVLVMVRGMGLHQGVRISQAQMDVTFNQDVKALVPTSVDGTHLLFAMLEASRYLFSKVQASGHGTGVLPTDILDSLTFPIPPKVLANSLVEALVAINRRISANVREQSSLAQQRDKLLPRLLAGKIMIHH